MINKDYENLSLTVAMNKHDKSKNNFLTGTKFKFK